MCFGNTYDTVMIINVNFLPGKVRGMACRMVTQGSKGDVVVRAPASHQCGRGSKPASRPYGGWVCCWSFSLLREVFMRVLRHSPLLRYLHFQIPYGYGTHGHVQTVFWSFARPALRPKQSSARELNATRACLQALRGVVSYMLLSYLASQLFLSCHATQKGRTLRDETREIRPLDIDMWMGSEKIGTTLNYQGRVPQFVIKKSAHFVPAIHLGNLWKYIFFWYAGLSERKLAQQ